jgi:hypothetical protein
MRLTEYIDIANLQLTDFILQNVACFFFCCTLKLHVHPRHLCLFSGNYREDGRAWEAGMKRNNGVVYITIGPELVLPNRQITSIFFTILCTCCASSLLHLNLSQTLNRCMCIFNVSWGYWGFLNCMWGFQFDGKAKDPPHEERICVCMLIWCVSDQSCW